MPRQYTNEILKVCLEDSDTEDFATVPSEVSECFLLATMTALQKKEDGGKRIAKGRVFRLLVQRVGSAGKSACAFPALSTNAGTDCVGHVVRAPANPHATVCCF